MPSRQPHALPSRIGTHVDHIAHGKTIRVVKVRAGDFHARPEPYIRPNAEGPSFTRWGDSAQIRQDLDHFYGTGSLPYGGGKVC